jgi:TolB-like protein
MACVLTAGLIFQIHPASAAHSLAVLPFRDRSGFKGQWDLSEGISRLLSQRLAEVAGYQLVNHDTVSQLVRDKTQWSGRCEGSEDLAAVFDSLEVGFLICGSVEEFGISRFGVAAPSVGGFESYRAVVQVSFALWEQKAKNPLLEAEAEGKVTEKGLGLTFLGRPTEQMEEYEMLERLEFGSPPYMITIAGQATEALLTDMEEKIRAALPPQRDIESAIGIAVIVSVDGAEAYINRGFEDGLRVGDQFAVYTRGSELLDPETGEHLGYSDRKVGAIRVIFVKAAHLSRAKVIEGEGEVKPGDEFRFQ